MTDTKAPTSTGPADAALLWALHRAVAKQLMDALKRDKVRASMLDTARKFLADNGIQADAGANGLLRGIEYLSQEMKYPFQ